MTEEQWPKLVWVDMAPDQVEVAYTTSTAWVGAPHQATSTTTVLPVHVETFIQRERTGGESWREREMTARYAGPFSGNAWLFSSDSDRFLAGCIIRREWAARMR